MQSNANSNKRVFKQLGMDPSGRGAHTHVCTRTRHVGAAAALCEGAPGECGGRMHARTHAWTPQLSCFPPVHPLTPPHSARARAAPGAAAACGAAAAAELADCASYGKLDFFPAGYANRPDAWTRPNQMKAGNDDRYSLFPIALFGHPAPKLHFLPIHPLMLPGGPPVPEACRPAASWRRRTLGVEWGTVIRPAAFTWTATLDGRRAGGSYQTALSNLTEIPHWSASVWNLADVRGGGGRGVCGGVRARGRRGAAQGGAWWREGRGWRGGAGAGAAGQVV